MVLTNKQEEGLKIAVSRYYNHDPYTTISGYAGTGKSTLVKFIISALNIYPEDVAYVAYTGKAALILKEKNCPNATTAHKLLYKSYPRPDGTFYNKPLRPLEKQYKLIIVDEVSMLPIEMWELLLSHHIHVIALGDPEQLGPVKSADNHILDNPHIFLDEVMRQAQESEIIRLTMDIRKRKPLRYCDGKEVKIISQNNLIDGMYVWADVVISGTNQTKRAVDTDVREMLFGTRDPEPAEGDRVICLQNDWEQVSYFGDVLVNGLIGTISNIDKDYGVPLLNVKLTADFLPDGTCDNLDFIPDEAYFHNLLIDYNKIVYGNSTVTSENFKKFGRHSKPREFDYAYCLTCHKAQGSEYNNVLVLDERLPGDHFRWLYTAATRAKDKLIIIKDFRLGG